MTNETESLICPVCGSELEEAFFFLGIHGDGKVIHSHTDSAVAAIENSADYQKPHDTGHNVRTCQEPTELTSPSSRDGELSPLRAALDALTRLTFDASPDVYSLWTPDGRRIVFSSMRGGVASIDRYRLIDSMW